jgi:hypothetical protein
MVTAAQMKTLSTASNNIRSYYNLTNQITQVTAGRTPIRDWPLHIAELRTTIEGVIHFINSFDVGETFGVPIPPWLPNTTGYPQADILNQLLLFTKLL